ncbi:histidinol dehydrogenase [Treponema sp. HNW]|uniref:histidinol dehydrogenase n=1 Tax=Treponema sp. HNW TaxID=3116654 RepID=UPI003D09E088
MKIIYAADIPSSFFAPRSFTGSVRKTVQAVIDEVRKNGDKALFSYAQKFDKIDFSAASSDAKKTEQPVSPFEIPRSSLKECEKALKKKSGGLYDALCRSRDFALAFARKQRDCFYDFETELAPGLITGQKIIPVEHAGLYVPAGSFPLLSSVVMTSCPARAAGCASLILCTPPRVHPDEKDAPAVKTAWADEGILAAASICGIDRVFAVGGAQAVAAMAYGTESIPRCDVIAGPGNKYVAEAKRLVSGDAGIDMVAGPTEVFIIADGSAHADWIAADLLAQAEHDADAQAVFATPSKRLAEQVSAEVEKRLASLSTRGTACESIKRHGLIVITKSLEEAASIANRKAPEHLELAMDEGTARDKLVQKLHNYGSLFIGHAAAEVLGDYSAGLNHTLPTSGSARFTGGLSVRHFLKTVTTLRTAEKSERKNPAGADTAESADGSGGVEQALNTAAVLAHAEGLAAHEQAARIRLNGSNGDEAPVSHP